jgi:hypothetical protein
MIFSRRLTLLSALLKKPWLIPQKNTSSVAVESPLPSNSHCLQSQYLVVAGCKDACLAVIE